MTMKLVSQIVLGAITLAVVAGGVLLLFRQPPSGPAIQISLPEATATPLIERKVYISGAVRSPGVYDIRDGDRLDDVIKMAGGFSDDADQWAMNLSLRVKDEDHWHVPRLGEAPPASLGSAQRVNSAGKVNINIADLELLKTLTGIGDARARAIIEYREANGPFSSIEDLVNVPGIAGGILNSIRDQIEAQ